MTVSLSSGYHQRADGEESTGDRPILTNLLPRPPELLEPVPGLGRVRTELPSPTIHRTHSFPVRARVPAPSFPLVRRTIRSSIGRLLVPREREGLGRSSPPTTTSFTQTQNDSRPKTFRNSHIPTRAKGLAVNPGHQVTHTLQKAQSQIHWPLLHREADQPGHLQTPATSTLLYTPHFSCVTPQASPSICLCPHRSGTV